MRSGRRPTFVVVATILWALAQGGCVPQRIWEVPEFSGRVHRGRDPLRGATIVWRTLLPDSGGDRGARVASGVTDERGEFRIAGQRGWGVAILLPADAVVEWKVELESGGQNTVLWHERLVTPNVWTTPGRLRVDCDLLEADPCVLLGSDHSRVGPPGERLRRAQDELRAPG